MISMIPVIFLGLTISILNTHPKPSGDPAKMPVRTARIGLLRLECCWSEPCQANTTETERSKHPKPWWSLMFYKRAKACERKTSFHVCKPGKSTFWGMTRPSGVCHHDFTLFLAMSPHNKLHIFCHQPSSPQTSSTSGNLETSSSS